MKQGIAAVVFLASALCTAAQDCRCLPSDDCWPSTETWSALNETVEGRLIKTVPIGSPCHDPNYDFLACLDLQQRWTEPQTHITSSSSVMQMYFANQSCDAFTPRDQPCVLGNYVAYSVDIGTAEHVASAVQFASENNIRLVVRNTGHDFFGRSTGAGALSIWTHHLKSTEIIADYESSSYSGPALRVGAGVTGAEAMEATHGHGLAVVVGECPSVGLAGGFTQGGGHSTLSTAYGLAADQVLEYDVVTADGSVIKASPEENDDLYWALSGGGGGTYAVVTSMTVRAHPVGDIGGGSIKMLTNLTTPQKLEQVIKKFHELAPQMVDEGATVTYILNSQYLSFAPFTVVNSTGDHVRDVVAAPFLEALKELGVPTLPEFSTLAFRDHYDKYLGPLPWGNLASSEWQYGGRLLPRTAFGEGKTAVSDVIVDLLNQGTVLVGTVGNFAPPHDVNNAVLSTWRDTLIQLQILTPWSTDSDEWEANIAFQDKMTNDILPQIKAATPNSATYMNEADFREAEWKSEFFGANYDKLATVKGKWDPDSLLYILKGVGSDAWDVADDGKMCRT